MARISYGALATSIKGSVGGSTFQNNHYGFTIKNKGSIIRPNSVKQNRIKQYISAATKAWGSLEAVDRNQWNQYALDFPVPSKNNPSITLSGYALFVKYNVIYMLGNDNPLNYVVYPSLFLPTATIPTWQFQYTPGIDPFNTLYVDYSVVSEDWFINIELSAPMKPGVNFVGSNIRFITVAYNNTSPQTMSIPYVAKFGRAALPGERVAIRWQNYQVGGGMVESKFTQILTVIETE